MHCTVAHVSSEQNNDWESVKHVPPNHVDCRKTLPGKMKLRFKFERIKSENLKFKFLKSDKLENSPKGSQFLDRCSSGP